MSKKSENRNKKKIIGLISRYAASCEGGVSELFHRAFSSFQWQRDPTATEIDLAVIDKALKDYQFGHKELSARRTIDINFIPEPVAWFVTECEKKKEKMTEEWKAKALSARSRQAGRCFIPYPQIISQMVYA